MTPTEIACAARWEKHHADPARWFWKRVDTTAGPSACWPWRGRTVKARRGYGRLVYKGRQTGAHRMALALASGGDRSDRFACHSCDNPVCCNPAHLWWGTHQDNVTDCAMKGRKKGAPKRIDLDVCCRMRAAGNSYSRIAAVFGVNQTSIAKALKRAALRALASGAPR